MPKYFCDYCDTYLTHDSPSVRKTHCAGRKHKENVKAYYQNWLEQEAKNLIDITTAAFKNGTLVSQSPMLPQPAQHHQLTLMGPSPSPLLSSTPAPLLSSTPQPMLHPHSLGLPLQQLQHAGVNHQHFQQLQAQPAAAHLSGGGHNQHQFQHHLHQGSGQPHQLQVHTTSLATTIQPTASLLTTSLPSFTLGGGVAGSNLNGIGAAHSQTLGVNGVGQPHPSPTGSAQQLSAQSLLHHQQHSHQHQPQDIPINVPSPTAVTAGAFHLPNVRAAMVAANHPHLQHHLHSQAHHGIASHQPLLTPFLHSPFRPPMGLLIFRPQM